MILLVNTLYNYRTKSSHDLMLCSKCKHVAFEKKSQFNDSRNINPNWRSNKEISDDIFQTELQRYKFSKWKTMGRNYNKGKCHWSYHERSVEKLKKKWGCFTSDTKKKVAFKRRVERQSGGGPLVQRSRSYSNRGLNTSHNWEHVAVWNFGWGWYSR